MCLSFFVSLQDLAWYKSTKLNVGGLVLETLRSFWRWYKNTFNYHGMHSNFTWKHDHLYIMFTDKWVFSLVATTWLKQRNQPKEFQLHQILGLLYSPGHRHACFHTHQNQPTARSYPPHTSLYWTWQLILMRNMQCAVRPAFNMQQSHSGWFVVCFRSSEEVLQSHTDTMKDSDRWKQKIRTLRSFKLIYVCLCVSFLSLSPLSPLPPPPPAVPPSPL